MESSKELIKSTYFYSTKPLSIATEKSVGYDIPTSDVHYVLEPWQRITIGSGVWLNPEGFKAFKSSQMMCDVRPKSGLSKIGVLVSYGTVDADYSDEIGIIIQNMNPYQITIPANTSLAQLVITSGIVDKDLIKKVERTGGFGSTSSVDE